MVPCGQEGLCKGWLCLISEVSKYYQKGSGLICVSMRVGYSDAL